MNPLILILFIPLAILFYCIAATLLRLPSFKSSSAFKKSVKKRHTLSAFMDTVTHSAAKSIHMNQLRRSELQKSLVAAGILKTPEEYLAGAVVPALLFLLLAIPVYFLNPVLALIPVAFAGYFFYTRYTEAGKKSNQRRLAIEKELPRFVSYMANSLRSSRNVLDLIDNYKANYDSPLTEELSITAADMRTGNQERALQHLQVRIHSELLDELVRGLLSSLRGDDMTAYFNNLSYKLTSVWQQRLKEQALKKEPKITRMSYLLFACAIVSIFVILGVMVKSSGSLLGVGIS